LQCIFKVFLIIHISQKNIEALGQNIIEVLEGFASQEGLEIFTSVSFTLAKLVKKRFYYVKESFHRAAIGLITCIMMIIQ